jgi:diguanylate cyclase (GGDEF)-like protein
VTPGGLVLGATYAWVQLMPGPDVFTPFTVGFPYAFFSVAGLIAWRFHRSRALSAILALAVVERMLHHLSQAGGAVVFAIAAGLLPLTLAVLSLLEDRGVLSPKGMLQIVGIVIQPALVALLLAVGADWTVHLFRFTLFDQSLTDWAGIPQPAVFGFLVSTVLVATVAVRTRETMQRALVWTLATAFFAFKAGTGTGVSSLYFMAAASILALSVVETSYVLAFHDELTGLPGRRALPAALASLGGRYSIAMLDVDRFKKFNDRHGHHVGDQVLRMVAGKLAKVSGGGTAYRYGGEEFTVIFPRLAPSKAIPFLEELRKEVESSTFTVRRGFRLRKRPPQVPRKRRRQGQGLSVTISIGVAGPTKRIPTAEKVLKAADKALYRAKETGRNRVSK